MAMTIGELARCLRISPRAVRHYEQLGLLLPDDVDARNGYRWYGSAALVRGMRIEQLKAAGLTLAAIGEALDGSAAAGVTALRRERPGVHDALVAQQERLATIDAILGADVDLGEPAPYEVPSGHVLVTRCAAAQDDLAATIRRAVQRLRRVAKAAGADPTSFSARFPLDVGRGPVDVDVVAHLDAVVPGAVLQPPERRLGVVIVGPLALLPLAYAAVLTTARDRRLPLAGTVVEHYLDLARIGRTDVAVVLAPPP